MSTTPQYTPRDYKAGDRLSAGDMNARGRELQRLGRLTVAGGQVTSDGTGHHIVLPAGISYIWGKITGRGTGANDNAHSWTQQRNIGDGAFEGEDNPIVGDAAATPLKNPAYEITGQLADNDKIVQLWPGRPIISGSDYIQPWFFGLGGGGGSELVVREILSDGTTVGSGSVADVVEVRFETDSFSSPCLFNVQDDADGKARIQLKGFTGTKTVVTNVVCTSTGFTKTTETWTFKNGLLCSVS